MLAFSVECTSMYPDSSCLEAVKVRQNKPIPEAIYIKWNNTHQLKRAGQKQR